MIIGSATLNGLPDRAKRPKHSTNKAFDKSGVYSESPKVADTMIEAVSHSEISKSQSMSHKNNCMDTVQPQISIFLRFAFSPSSNKHSGIGQAWLAQLLNERANSMHDHRVTHTSGYR